MTDNELNELFEALRQSDCGSAGQEARERRLRLAFRASDHTQARFFARVTRDPDLAKALARSLGRIRLNPCADLDAVLNLCHWGTSDSWSPAACVAGATPKLSQCRISVKPQIRPIS